MVGGKLTRLHLWLGELLGITRYESCWGCRHAHVLAYKGDGSPCMNVCACDLNESEHEVRAITCPCEAAWCEGYEKRGI